MAEIIMIQVLLRRWMIPRNREHSHSGTVTVEKQQQQYPVTEIVLQPNTVMLCNCIAVEK